MDLYKVETRIYLAPLQSYTNVFYRFAFNAIIGGVDKYFTPFFEQGKSELFAPSLLPELSPDLNSKKHVVPQVATNDGDFLIRFGKEVNQLGYGEINLNMGCPFPMLVKRQKGGGLMSELDLLDVMLERFFKEGLKIKLSVKMRAGNTLAEDGMAVIKVLNRYPLNEVIVHPRLVKQKYSGQPDWDVFNHMQDAIAHPVIANGDINSIDSLRKIENRFPQINGSMLGRGLLSDPFLLKSGEIGLDQKIEQYRQFHDLFRDLVCEHCINWNQAFNYLQNFWYYPLLRTVTGKRHLRRLKKSNSQEAYETWLKELWFIIFNDYGGE